MSKLNALFFATALLIVPVIAGAADEDMKNDAMAMKMKTMDANNDGMISKKEFMDYHAMMWDKMPKNKEGMVTMSDMMKMHSGMHGTDAGDMDSMKH